jgi:hypothetical protein
MKHHTRRWGPTDKRKAYWKVRWLPAFMFGSAALGIILFAIVQWGLSTVHRNNVQVQAISTLILKYNKDFEKAWLRPTAQYIIDNAYPFDPILMASIMVNESGAERKAESPAGAEGFWQIKPQGDDHKIPKMQRLQLAFQLEKAKERLLYFYENGYCQTAKGKRRCGYGKETVIGMHYGYVGVDKNFADADKYIARIYTDRADVMGLVWQKEPKEEVVVENKGKEIEQP